MQPSNEIIENLQCLFAILPIGENRLLRWDAFLVEHAQEWRNVDYSVTKSYESLKLLQQFIGDTYAAELDSVPLVKCHLAAIILLEIDAVLIE